MSPLAFLQNHPITLALRASGITDQQLDSIRFWKCCDDTAFEHWPITFAGPIETGQLSGLRAYCALKWLVEEEPPSPSHHEAAARLVSEHEVHPIFQDGVNFHRTQRERARRPRPVTSDRRNLKTLVEELCNKPENRAATARDLWPKLFAMLNDLEMEPEDRGDRYLYQAAGDRSKTIAFASFVNLVSKFRRHP
jgi:hypothetical protein